MARTSQKQREEAAQQAAIESRRRSVVQYRLLGLTYRAIGEKLGISHEQARADEMAVRAEVKAGTEEGIEELRTRENERLDMASAAIATQVLKGDLGAVDRWVKISERRARLNGLDRVTSLGEGEEGVVLGVVMIPAKATDAKAWAAQAQATQKTVAIPVDEEEE